VWPVGVWNARKPAISDGFHTQRRDPRTGVVIEHGGVDIMYPRQPGDLWRAGTPNGTPNWVMPDHRAALAASDGVVWSATNTPRGWTVVVDHAPRQLATYYTHMSSLLVSAKQSVTAGTPLGIIGADPLDGEHLMHLHFEVWRGGAKDRFDPQRLIETTWEYVPDPGDLPRPLVARNGGHRPKDGASYSIPVTLHYRRAPRR
jgi:murein DD-endopeptidase MepM/ murein hydrolase activator NlpD